MSSAPSAVDPIGATMDPTGASVEARRTLHTRGSLAGTGPAAATPPAGGAGDYQSPSRGVTTKAGPLLAVKVRGHLSRSPLA
jgi:hypothetical protein